MIGWKCKIGYTQKKGSIINNNKISDYTFTDSGYFIIADGYNQGSISYGGQYPTNSSLWQSGGSNFNNPIDGQNALINAIGDDFYTIYGSPFAPYKNQYEILETCYPSLKKMYPNLWRLVEDGLTPTHIVIIIPGINRALGYPDFGGSTNPYAGKISGDTITWAGNIGQFQYNIGPQNVGFPVLKTIYSSEIDLSDPNNYVFYFAVNNTTPEYFRRVKFFENNPSLAGIKAFFKTLFSDNPAPDITGPDLPPDNPYGPGGDSGEGGGGGSFDDSSDQIVDSSIPTLSSANTGFTRIYNPTLSQVQDLAQYLWTDESVIQTIWNHIKQFFENPMEAIIGFNLVPVPVPNGGTKNFALMYIDTGVQMTVAANQFVDQDCGTLEIPLYYGSALDYSPYTKISCFLPFIGMVQLNTDEVMGRTLQVKYRVDICSGSCVAKIFVDGNCLYQYSGHCAINIPISAADFSSYVTASISVAKLAVGAAAAGASGLVAASTVDPTQQTNQVITRTTETTTARNPSTGRQITTGTRSIVETVERPSDISSTQASFDGISPANISNTVGQIMSSKPHVEHSGSFSGNTGYLGIRRPYVVIERPNMCMPDHYQQFNGFPAMITMALSECTGFTRIQQVQLTGMEATNPEQSEILQMLKSGVIL